MTPDLLFVRIQVFSLVSRTLVDAERTGCSKRESQWTRLRVWVVAEWPAPDSVNVG